MTQSEAINKLAKECCLAIGEFDHFKTIRTYIQMALVIGLEHYDVHDVEIVAMWRDGGEAGRYKSITDASNKLGIARSSIWSVLEGRRVSAGGLIFMRAEDYNLLPREEKSSSLSKNEL